MLLRRWIRYRRWFPASSIDPHSLVERGAALGPATVIHGATVGAGVSLGAGSTVGAGSCLGGRAPIRVGKFCSIGPHCYLRSDNHTLEACTTYPLEQMLLGRSGEDRCFPGREIRLGHDVWLGRGVTVLAGADLGTGCVVAAGCVVTGRRFPPYSLVGGVPGRVLRARFSEAAITRLLREAWWDRPLEEIFGPLKDQLLAPPPD